MHGWGRENREIKCRIIKHSGCDLVSLNETWLRPDQNDIHIDGYKWIDNRQQLINKRSNAGSGGVGILVADHLYYTHRIEISDNCVDRVLAITLINKCSDYRILFVTVYQPPDNSLYGRDSAQLLSHLTNLMYTNAEYDAIYIATDMNGRIGAESTTLRQ